MGWLSVSLCCLLVCCGCLQQPYRERRPEPVRKTELTGFTKWLRVRDSELSRPTFCRERADIAVPEAAGEWASLYLRLREAPDMEKLRSVNAFFNRWPYKEDRDLWGKEDHWATPREFMEQAGDCEDFAVTKYFALRELGFSPASMRIACVWDKRQARGHAILLVETGGRTWTLDYASDLPEQWDTLSRYVPQFYVNEHDLWDHGTGK